MSAHELLIAVMGLFALLGAALIPIHIALSPIGFAMYGVSKVDDMGKQCAIKHIAPESLGIDLQPPLFFYGNDCSYRFIFHFYLQYVRVSLRLRMIELSRLPQALE